MANVLPSSLSDHDLLLETARAAAAEGHATAALLALLAEVDSPAAYSRITAARTARRFPVVSRLLDEGAVSLTTMSLLSAHLTEENHVSVIEAARHKSKRDVERLVASLHPQPDVAPSVRALPAARVVATAAVVVGGFQPAEPSVVAGGFEPAGPTAETTRRPAVAAPLAPGRYLLRMTIGEGTRQKLQRARDLLRHVIPDGDPALILDRALAVLLQQAERAKCGSVERPRAPKQEVERAGKGSRRVPSAVRRAVWARDQGRCAFIGSDGRCAETGRLEFHHVVPFARGGATTVENLQLRCRTHNAYEGEQVFGDWRRRTRKKDRTRGVNSVRTELGKAINSCRR